MIIKKTMRYHELRSKVMAGLGDFEEAYKEKIIYHELYVEVEKRNGEKLVNQIVNHQMDKATKRLDAIAKIGRELTTLKSDEAVLDEVYQNVSSMMDVANLGVGRLEEDAISYKTFFLEDSTIVTTIVTPLKEKNSLAVWCIDNTKEIVIGDLNQEYSKYVPGIRRWVYEGSSKHIQSVIYIPLLHRGKTIGILSVQSYEKNAYTQEDIETIRIISSYVAIGLVNAKQSEALRQLSIRDNLTGLLNRRGFSEGYDKLLKADNEAYSSVAMIMLDLDFFKAINDAHGHLAGDQVLSSIGRELSNIYSDVGQVLARLGGEEFALLVIDESIDIVEALSEDIRCTIENMCILYGDKSLSLTTSVGVAYYEDTMPELEELYQLSDDALYKAKKTGRNQVVLYKYYSDEEQDNVS